MSLPIFELVKSVATDAYKQDPSAVEPLLELVLRQPGALGAWHGREEDSEHFYVAVAWESVEHHKALMENTKVFAIMGELISRVSVGAPVYLYHVPFSAPIDTALAAPFTELAMFTLKPEAVRDGMPQKLDTLLQQMYEQVPEDVHAGGWGSIVEDERKFLVCLGWQDLERFWTEIRKHDVYNLIQELRERADIDIKHARFKKFVKA